MALIARYRLNGSVADATGKTTILSQAGSPTYGIGKLGTCMNFDGIDDTIETSLNPSLVLDPKVFSISVWCKITDTSNYRGLFGCHLDTGPGGTTTGLALQFDSGYFYCILGSGVGSKWYYLRMPAANVPLNKLMNIMLIANGKTFKLFIDGVDMNCSFVDYTGSVVSFETATIKLGPRFLIGRGWDGVDRYFKGTLEDLRIYDHALSAKETKEILKAKILHLTFDDYEEPTINLLQIEGLTENTTLQLTTFTYDPVTITRRLAKAESTSVGHVSARYNKSVKANTDYSISFEFKCNNGRDPLVTEVGVHWRGGYAGYNKKTILPDGWCRIELTRNTFADTSNNMGIGMYDPNPVDITCRKFQLEEKSYVTPYTDGTRYKTNLHFEAYDIYNNFAMAASLVATGEYYLGEKVYRLTMTPSTQAMVDSMKVNLGNHGIMASGLTTFLANTRYATSVLWRPVNKPDTYVGGTASNINGWSEIPAENFKDGWKMSGQYRTGDTTDKIDRIFISMKSPSMVLGDSLVVEFCGLRTEKDTTYCSKYYNGLIEDKSEFGNHVNITDVATAVPFTKDSKLGEQGLAFDGKMRPIALNKIVPGCLTNCSVSFWKKHSVNDYWLLFSENDIRLSEQPAAFFMATDLGTAFYDTVAKVTGNKNFYLDGVLKTGVDRKDINDGTWHHYVISGVNLSTWSKLMMNTYSIPGVNGSANWHMKGTFDDLRIYSTELSQADVNDLYKVRASIDKAGNFLAHKFEPNDVEDGCIAYYPLNGDVLNRKGLSDGNIYGATKIAGRGQEFCYEFDNVDDYGDIENVFPGRNTFSISAWVYPKKTNCLIIGDHEHGVTYESVRFSTGEFCTDSIGTNATNRLQVLGFESSVVLNSWNHMVATFDYLNKRTQIYVNNVLVIDQSFTVSCLPYNSGRRQRLGYDYGILSSALAGGTKGMLQQLRIYDKVISKDIVNKLFTESFKKFSISKKGVVRANKVSTRGVTDRLIGYWKLDGSSWDLESGRNATNFSATWDKGLNQQRAAKFDGSSNFITHASTAFNMIAGQAFSVSCWIKPELNGTKYMDIVGVRTGTSLNWLLYQHLTDGSIQLHGTNRNKSSYIPPLNQWTMITATVAKDGTSKLYANNQLVQTFTGYAPGPTGCHLTMGKWDNNTEFYKGCIQDVKIYLKELSLAEIKLNYNLTKADRIPFSVSKDGILYARSFKDGI